MTDKTHYSVQRLILDIRHGRQGNAIEKQNKISKLYHKTVAPLLEKTCRELCPDNHLLKIDTLIIEVPPIAEDQLESRWAREVDKAFRKSLLQAIKQNIVPESKNVYYISQADADLELLMSFLYTGMLPWSYSENRDRPLETIFRELIADTPEAIRLFLREGLKQSSFTKRLCYQFPELILNELPELLHPNHAENFLNAHKILQNSFENTAHLKNKYNIVFLLNYHSLQQFAKQPTWNEKHFVAEVLEQLSQEWIIPYGELLKILLQNVKLAGAKKQTDYSTVLEDLWKESATDSEKEKVLLSENLEKNLKEYRGKTGQESELDKVFKDTIKEFLEKHQKQGTFLNPKETTENSFQQELQQLFQQAEHIINTFETEKALLQKKLRESIREFIHEIKNRPSEIAKLSGNLEKNVAQLLDKQEPIDSTYNTFKKPSQILLENVSQQLAKREDIPKLHKDMDTDAIYLQNAGMVIVWPFFIQLFETLKFTKKKQFISEDKQYRAVYLLQYLVNGTEDCKEFQLPLNKLLCGLELSEPVPKQILLTKEEKEYAEDLIKAAMGYWPVMKNTSVEGFRETFLKREGKLSRSSNGRLLKVAQKSYDVIMSKLPWGVGPVKLPWMPEALFVEW